MKELVRADSVQPVGRAVRKVRVEAADEYGDDEDFFIIPILSIVQSMKMLHMNMLSWVRMLMKVSK